MKLRLTLTFRMTQESQMVSTLAYPHTDAMRSLHWLPVAYRIRFRLCLMMYAVYNGTSPFHIADTTTRISAISGRGKLRSANTSEFDVPQEQRTKFAFFVALPREWNALPVAIRNIAEVSAFKRAMKTLLIWHILTQLRVVINLMLACKAPPV